MASQIGPRLFSPAISLEPHFSTLLLHWEGLSSGYYPYRMRSLSENHDCQLSPISHTNDQALKDFQYGARYIPSFHKSWSQANWLFCFGTRRNGQAHSQQVPSYCPDSFCQGPDPWTVPGEACLQAQSSQHMCTSLLDTSYPQVSSPSKLCEQEPLQASRPFSWS